MLLLLVVATALAQVPTNDLEAAGGKRKTKPAPLNADLPFLECPVCEKAASEALRQVSALVAAEPKHQQSAKKRRFEHKSELGQMGAQAETMLTELCNPDNDGLKEYNKPRRSAAGVWLASLDVAKQGQELVLKASGDGHCRRECRTIAKSCDRLLERLGDGDDDFAEFLLRAAREKVAEETVVHTVCQKMVGVCKPAKRKLWPEGKVRKNELFKLKTAQDKKLEQQMEILAGENGNGITMMRPGDYEVPGVPPPPPDEIDILKDEL